MQVERTSPMNLWVKFWVAIRLTEQLEDWGFWLVANEVVTRGNVPFSREQLTERLANTRWSRKSKDLSLKEQPAEYQLVGKVMAYQGYDA